MTTTETSAAAAVTKIVDTYLASLNEADDALRAELVAAAFTPEARFVDPLQEAQGHAALAELAPLVQQHFPGAQFRRQSAVDAHHELVRFGWDLANPDGSVVVAGIDVGLLADDGRLACIVGFFGDLPQE